MFYIKLPFINISFFIHLKVRMVKYCTFHGILYEIGQNGILIKYYFIFSSVKLLNTN